MTNVIFSEDVAAPVWTVRTCRIIGVMVHSYNGSEAKWRRRGNSGNEEKAGATYQHHIARSEIQRKAKNRHQKTLGGRTSGDAKVAAAAGENASAGINGENRPVWLAGRQLRQSGQKRRGIQAASSVAFDERRAATNESTIKSSGDATATPRFSARNGIVARGIWR